MIEIFGIIAAYLMAISLAIIAFVQVQEYRLKLCIIKEQEQKDVWKRISEE